MDHMLAVQEELGDSWLYKLEVSLRMLPCMASALT